jgi:FKBP-type peptidyl-prolyl cis-trans isomerase FklB
MIVIAHGPPSSSRGILRFAVSSDSCENASMKKSFTTAVIILASGLLSGNARSQQASPSNPPAAPAAKAQQAPPAKAPQAPAAKPPAAKPRQTPAAKGPAPLALKTQKEKASYAIGMNIGKGLQRDSVDVDSSILLRGLRDGLAGRKSLLTDEEAKAAMIALQTDVRKRQEEKMQLIGETNKETGTAFLVANKTKEGVVTLPSGLQYKILKEGTGPKPSATDSVVCNYKGTLLDNTEFDSSYKRGQPATFPVVGVIKGWTEALQLMPVGSKWQLFVPSELAYGPRSPGPGSGIGPNSTLIFEVELLSIQSKVEPAVPVAPASPADVKPN